MFLFKYTCRLLLCQNLRSQRRKERRRIDPIKQGQKGPTFRAVFQPDLTFDAKQSSARFVNLIQIKFGKIARKERLLGWVFNCFMICVANVTNQDSDFTRRLAEFEKDGVYLDVRKAAIASFVGTHLEKRDGDLVWESKQ